MTESALGPKQLIVLGNGFDLECGLKSSYKDFFEQHFAEIILRTISVEQRTNIVKQLSTVYSEDQCDKVYKAFSEECSGSFLKLWSKPRTSKENNCIEKLMAKAYEQLRNRVYSEIKGVQRNRYMIQDNLREIDYFSEITFLNKNFNRWDVLFLFAECCLSKQVGKYQWQDVETLIYEIVSIALLPPDKLTNIDSKITYNEDNIELILGESAKGEELFKYIVGKIAYTGNGTREEIASVLLKDLAEFERVFAEFVDRQFKLQQGDPYFNHAYDLIKCLTRFESNGDVSSSFKVLSFNYSIDRRFMNFWKDQNPSPSNVFPKIEDWANIHGIASYATPWQSAFPVQDDYKQDEKYLPAPIFGIDSQNIIKDSLTDDLRILFTKSYRIMDNGVNRIRESGDYSDIDKITIYGHSLGRADYSYFETIFDEVSLYNSDVMVEYFYYQGNSEVERILNKRTAITKMFNLLTDYGKSLGETHGANIVAKLDLEKRLSVVPMDYL